MLLEEHKKIEELQMTLEGLGIVQEQCRVKFVLGQFRVNFLVGLFRVVFFLKKLSLIFFFKQ